MRGERGECLPGEGKCSVGSSTRCRSRPESADSFFLLSDSSPGACAARDRGARDESGGGRPSATVASGCVRSDIFVGGEI